jgi:hypothetical protein
MTLFLWDSPMIFVDHDGTATNGTPIRIPTTTSAMMTTLISPKKRYLLCRMRNVPK